MKENQITQETVEQPKNIKVKPYLTYAQIQNIVNQVEQFDTWAERETAIDFMLMSYATDMPEKDVEAIGHDTLVSSGTMDGVRNLIKNLDRVYDAIAYTESTARALKQILEEMPKMMEPLKEMQEKYAKRKK